MEGPRAFPSVKDSKSASRAREPQSSMRQGGGQQEGLKVDLRVSFQAGGMLSGVSARGLWSRLRRGWGKGGTGLARGVQ